MSNSDCWDTVWNLPTEGQFDDLVDEASYLGEMMAAQHNKFMDLEVYGTTEHRRIKYAWERRYKIVDVLGIHAAENAFAISYDAIIDFSLNTDWMESL